MVTLSKPSANRWRLAAALPVKMMESLPLRLQAAGYAFRQPELEAALRSVLG